MESLYPMIVAFMMIFVAELGDKTQLLVLSFSGALKAKTILLGVALGSLFSHGIAIIFGSHIGLLENPFLHHTLKVITYLSFILIGILSLVPKKEKISPDSDKKDGLIQSVLHLKLPYTLLIALTIAIGELGDKTFLASIGFGIEYPNAKALLVVGSILGMVISDSIAILFGKFLSSHISDTMMQKVSGILFLVFGIIGFLF